MTFDDNGFILTHFSARELAPSHHPEIVSHAKGIIIRVMRQETDVKSVSKRISRRENVLEFTDALSILLDRLAHVPLTVRNCVDRETRTDFPEMQD